MTNQMTKPNEQQETLDDYLNRPYRLLITPDEDGGYVAYVLDLPGCMTDADSWEALPGQIREAMSAWISASLERGESIPDPSGVDYPLPRDWRVQR